jgi:hypothetical protein
MLQATFGQTTPEERVLRTRSALRAFTEDDIRQPLRVVPVIRYGQPGRLFLMNGKPVLLLSQADLDEGDDLTLDQAAQRVLARMEAQRTSLQEQFNQRYLLISAGKALAGRCCWRCFTTAPSAPGGGYGAFSSCGSSKSAALFRSTGGASRQYRGPTLCCAGHPRCAGLLHLAELGLQSVSLDAVWSESLGDWSLGVIRDLAVDCRFPAGADDRGAYFSHYLAHHSPGEGGSRPGRRRPHSGSRHSSGDRERHPSAYLGGHLVVRPLRRLPVLPGANSLAFKGISVFFGLMLTLGRPG